MATGWTKTTGASYENAASVAAMVAYIGVTSNPAITAPSITLAPDDFFAMCAKKERALIPKTWRARSRSTTEAWQTAHMRARSPCPRQSRCNVLAMLRAPTWSAKDVRLLVGFGRGCGAIDAVRGAHPISGESTMCSSLSDPVVAFRGGDMDLERSSKNSVRRPNSPCIAPIRLLTVSTSFVMTSFMWLTVEEVGLWAGHLRVGQGLQLPQLFLIEPCHRDGQDTMVKVSEAVDRMEGGYLLEPRSTGIRRNRPKSVDFGRRVAQSGASLPDCDRSS